MDNNDFDYDMENFKNRIIEVLKSEPVNFWMDALDASRSAISHKWIKGITVPKGDLLWKILEVKKISADWLFFGYGPKKHIRYG